MKKSKVKRAWIMPGRYFYGPFGVGAVLVHAGDVLLHTWGPRCRDELRAMAKRLKLDVVEIVR